MQKAVTIMGHNILKQYQKGDYCVLDSLSTHNKEEFIKLLSSFEGDRFSCMLKIFGKPYIKEHIPNNYIFVTHCIAGSVPARAIQVYVYRGRVKQISEIIF